MSTEALEIIKQQITQLNAQELEQLERYLHQQKRVAALEPDVTEREHKRRLRTEWLNTHQNEYAGLYVALDGDRLLGTGRNYPEAFEKAKQEGVKNPYVGFVYPANYEGFMGGWS